MKKLIALMICLLMAGSVITAFPALVLAENTADFETPLWQPVEIPLTSSVKYGNPYLSAQIDVTFTHEDGTVITTPGFWNGDFDWAVRFSPTKEGLWTYHVTCTDETNTGLHNVTGTVKALPASGENPLTKHGFLKVDGRHFSYADGTPFYWLGDTSWQAPQMMANDKCNYPGCTCGSQMEHIINDRAAKGFTVLQTYFSATTTDRVEGNQSYWMLAGSKVNPKVFKERIDHLFAYANQMGLVVAVGFGCHHGTFNMLTEDAYLGLVRYCVARYSCYNVVWITGQEITDTAVGATSGKEVMSSYLKGAQLTEDLDGYKHPNGAHMYPMVYGDERAQRLENSQWHDWWTLQSGHGNDTKGIQKKDFYKTYYNSIKKKPYLEAECNYEEINCNGFVNADAPRYAAWYAMLNGCCGYTYGCDGLWLACLSTSVHTAALDPVKSYGYEAWYMTLNKPGSFQMGYMRSFFELLPDWTKLIPRFNDTSYADFAARKEKVIASTEDRSLTVCYFYNTDTTTGVLKKLEAKTAYNGYWYDTLTGAFLQPVTLNTAEDGTIELPEKPNRQDWVLLLTKEPLQGTFRTENKYEPIAPARSEVSGDKAVPVKVTANGGVFYTGNKQVMTDPTAYLFDNDPATVWKPFADRVSQTILVDLGKTYELKGITVTPNAGTILPRFYRVEVSDDEKNWTVLVNTYLRGDEEDNTAISDVLTGVGRYVKLVLLNAESVRKIDADRKGFKVFNNNETFYSCTEIADMAVLVGAEATPEPTAEVTPIPEQTDAPQKKTGCGSVLAVTPMLLLPLAALTVRKRKNGEDQ